MTDETENETDDGGTAFPCPYPGGGVWSPGMTLEPVDIGRNRNTTRPCGLIYE